MKARTALWPIIIGLALAASAVQAASVTAVRVNDLADRVEIRVSVDGPAQAWVNQSAAGQWIALDIRGEYQCKPVRQAVRSQYVKAVRAGWFQNRPPLTRVAVTTAAKVPYELGRAGDGSLTLTVWKGAAAQQAAKAAATSRPAESAAATPALATSVAPAPAAKPAPVPVSVAVNPTGPPLTALPVASVPPPAPRLDVKEAPRAATVAAPPAQPPAPKRDLMAFRPAPVARTQEPVVRVAAEAEVLEPGSPEPRPVRTARAPESANTSTLRSTTSSPISLNMVATDINDVLKALTMQAGVNVVTATDVKGEVTVSLQNVDFESALNSITRLSGYRWIREGSTYYVGSDKSINSFRSGADAATEVITMTRGSAQDMLTVLKAQYPNLVASLPAQQTDGKTLILSGPKEDVEAARTLVALVDQSIAPTESRTEVEVYRIKHARASSLVATLERLVPTLRVATGSVSAPLDFLRPVGKDDLVYRKAVEQEDSKSGSGGGGGGEAAVGAPARGKGDDKKASVDDASRMLVLSGTRSDIERGLEILRRVDVAAPQVIIEARLVDIGTNSALKQGFLYDQSLNGFNIGASGTAAAGTTTTRSFSMFLDATLEAEIKDGKARLLASPKISVVEGDTATIFIGDQITYIESIQATTSGITVTTNKVNAGIELGVMPLVNVADATISMKIHPEVSTPTLVTDRNTGVTLPQVATRFADTSVRIKDGDTVVIGGLLNENEVSTLTRIPFLSDLPFLGNLFKHRDRTTDQRELVIFITCRISPDVP
ncbi:MAG: type II secretion system protein GspD [Armatimonadota bacterium]